MKKIGWKNYPYFLKLFEKIFFIFYFPSYQNFSSIQKFEYITKKAEAKIVSVVDDVDEVDIFSDDEEEEEEVIDYGSCPQIFVDKLYCTFTYDMQHGLTKCIRW